MRQVAGKFLGGLLVSKETQLLYAKPPKPPAMPCRRFLVFGTSVGHASGLPHDRSDSRYRSQLALAVSRLEAVVPVERIELPVWFTKPLSSTAELNRELGYWRERVDTPPCGPIFGGSNIRLGRKGPGPLRRFSSPPHVEFGGLSGRLSGRSPPRNFYGRCPCGPPRHGTGSRGTYTEPSATGAATSLASQRRQSPAAAPLLARPTVRLRRPRYRPGQKSSTAN